MITILPFQSVHALAIADVLDVTFIDSMKEHERRGLSFTAIYDREIMCCGGVTIMWPGVGEVWTVNGPLTRKYPIQFHKLIKRWLHLLTKKHGLHRIQAVVDATNETHVRWIEALGFSREGMMRQYYRRRDFYLYAIVKEV